jgi:hypothetical protein
MASLRAQARQGILGQDRATVAASVALLALVFVARIPYDLVKQHHVLDIAGGLVLAFSTSLLFRRLVVDHPAALFRSPARPG